MKTVRMVLQLPEDIAKIINENSTHRGKAQFVTDCVRKAMRRERDGDGILERLVLAVEKKAANIDVGGIPRHEDNG